MDRKSIRKYPRVEADFPVEYEVGGRTARGRASTLGGGGLLLQDALPLAPGTEIVIRFRPTKRSPLIQARAVVCYQSTEHGAGLKFTQIGPGNQQLLLRLIHQKTGNRRRYPRIPLATQVYWSESMWLAFSRDLSLGGMFVESKQSAPVGSRVTLRFHLDDGGPIVVAVADVRYAIPNMGMGVEFFDMTPADRERVEMYVSRLSTPSESSAEAPPAP